MFMALGNAPEAGALGVKAPPGLDLSIVVPTYNERGNVERVIAALDLTLQGIAWQVIFVDDDSPDGTAAAVKAIAATDSRVQCLHRVGRRGLAGAVIEGAMASAAPFVAVMDGDMQHDETLLPAMFAPVKNKKFCWGVSSML